MRAPATAPTVTEATQRKMSDWEWAVLPNGVQTATRESTDHISTMLFVGPAKTHTGNTLLVTRDKANNETRMTYIQTSPNQ